MHKKAIKNYEEALITPVDQEKVAILIEMALIRKLLLLLVFLLYYALNFVLSEMCNILLTKKLHL